MRIGDNTLNVIDTHNLRITAFSLFGSALSTLHSFIGGILRLAIPAIVGARAFPIVGSIIDIPMQFYEVGVGLKQWLSTPNRKIGGLYQATIGFTIDSLINAEGLGAAVAPLAFALAGPILLLTGFGIATLYFANELKNNIKQYTGAKKFAQESEQKSAKRKILTNGGFMLGALALIAAVSAVTFSPVGPAAATAFAGIFIGIALYRLIIKLVRPVGVTVSLPQEQKSAVETETARPALINSSQKKIEIPAAVVIGAGLGFDIPKSCCYAT